MDRFWDALEKSYLITGAALIMFGGTACAIWARGEIVPTELLQVIYALIGAFIGGSAVKRGLAAKSGG